MGSILKADTPTDLFWPAREPIELGVPLRQALGLQRLAPARGAPVLGRREGILLGVFALVLHGAAIHWLANRPEPLLPDMPVKIPEMTIEFSSPAPQAVEPPPPAPVPEPVVEPPPPVVEELAVKPPPKPQPPKPKPQPPKPVPQPVAPQPLPPAATPPVAPVAPVASAPVTPPSANAGYLRNPAPEYPSFAQRRGWEGTVLLRVRVLASGKPSDIQIQRSSGRGVLDEAAIRAVKHWSFVPAKRGEVAQDGWVSVPIDFKLN